MIEMQKKIRVASSFTTRPKIRIWNFFKLGSGFDILNSALIPDFHSRGQDSGLNVYFNS